jgi:hypothetical protein
MWYSPEMRVRGRWRAALPAAVVVLLTVALTGAGVSPMSLPSSAAADPTTPSASAAPGSTTADAIVSAVVEAQATAEAEAAETAAEVAASAEAVTSAVGAVDGIADEAGVWVGVAVLDRVTGEIAVGAEGAKPIAAASLTKLYTVVDVLTRAGTGQITLTDADQRLILRALTASDDGAMNALWSRFGGSATVAGAIALAGLRDSRPPSDPSQWGEAVVSARDLVALYDYVLTRMKPTDRDLVIGALTASPDVAADGFHQDFGLLAPPRRPGVAAKQGWMWWGPTFYLHSAGTLGPDERYVVAIESTSRSSAVGRATVNRATAAATLALR